LIPAKIKESFKFFDVKNGIIEGASERSGWSSDIRPKQGIRPIPIQAKHLIYEVMLFKDCIVVNYNHELSVEVLPAVRIANVSEQAAISQDWPG
jgi:hypothetical protein